MTESRDAGILPAADVNEGGLHGNARYLSVLVIMLGISLCTLDNTIMNLALPDIGRDLQSSAADSVWIINSYQLAILALLLPLASLGGFVGHRRVYLVGVVIFLAASLYCFFASSLLALAVGRGIQGVGAAGMMAVNASLMRLTYPRSLLGRGMVLNAAMIAVSTCAGPTVAAAVLSVASWPWLFAFNLPLCILIVVVGWFTLPHNPPAPRARESLALLDVGLNILTFGLVFLAVRALGSLAGDTPGSVSTAVALAAGGLVVGFFYIRRQLRLPVPLFPIDLLRLPAFSLAVVTSITSFVAQTLAFIALPFLMLDGWHYSHLEAAGLLTVWPLSIVLVAPLTGRMIGRQPSGLLASIGLAALALGLGLMTVLPEVPALADVAWRIALCGAGFGLFQSPNNHTIISTPPVERSGAASGMLGTARLTGQLLGAVLLAILFSIVSAHDGRGPVIALAMGSVFAALGCVLAGWRLRLSKMA